MTALEQMHEFRERHYRTVRFGIVRLPKIDLLATNWQDAIRENRARNKRAALAHLLSNYRELVVKQAVRASFKSIERTICLKHSLTPSELWSHRRAANLVAARGECWVELYRRTTISVAEIGRLTKRDHTTILHAFKKAGLTPDKPGVRHGKH